MDGLTHARRSTYTLQTPETLIQRATRYGLTLLLCSSAACTTKPASETVATVADSLQGTWRVVPARAVPGSDTIKYRYGFAPVGYLVYDRTGHVFWQILRKSAMDSLKLGRSRHVPDSILMRLSEGYSAQFGTYTVDANLRTVTHHYEGEIPPYGGGYEVATPFRLKADSLFIGGDSNTNMRLVRVR